MKKESKLEPSITEPQAKPSPSKQQCYDKSNHTFTGAVIVVSGAPGVREGILKIDQS